MIPSYRHDASVEVKIKNIFLHQTILLRYIFKLLLLLPIDYALIPSLRNEMNQPRKKLRSEICRSTVNMDNLKKMLFSYSRSGQFWQQDTIPLLCIGSYLQDGQSVMHFGACCYYIYTDNWHMMPWDFSLGISQLTV